MTKDQWLAWVDAPQTQEVFYEIRQLIAEGMEELAQSAGTDPIRDRYIVGKIRGLRDVLDLAPEEDVPEGELE